MKGVLILILAFCGLIFTIMGIYVTVVTPEKTLDPIWFRNLGLILMTFGVGILLVNTFWPGEIRKE